METAASIIAFVQITTEIAKCVIKTKKLWDQAQELPEDIQALILRLQCHQPIFDAMQQQLQHDDSLCSVQNDSLVRTNLDCCQMSLKTLQSTADDLISQLNAKKGLKRKLAAVKLALGKDGLDRLKNRLSESIELLKLSIMAWDIMYNIISSTSDIIKKIRVGDKAGVLELFNSRQASPFDKDQNGQSLLFHAADSKNFELCQLFLGLGLKDALLERVGESRQGALTPTVFKPDRDHPEADWMKIVELFHSYMDEPESSMLLRLFDYQRECDYGDEYVNIFRQRFLPKFYTGPLRYRLEAFRLASFHSQSPETLLGLLAENRQVTSFDVSHSSHENVSLVHSAALALGIRFADEVLPYKRGWAMWSMASYSEGWSLLVKQVTAVASPEDLHSIESVQPWDVYSVPAWKGTPLVSVIGGALCYMSPDITFFHWDKVFQESIRQWVLDLQESGVDLEMYGQREATTLKEQMRGALDADAIESSRHSIRDSLPTAAVSLAFRRGQRADRSKWNKNHWVPIRLLELKTGPTPSDWRIVWAPEFEWMACQFWEMIEKEDIVMPGSWVDV
ncbi:uncharacterized protein NECHADRAFT_75185 [Fusarium vanettenii 77-13-4]|uniref:Fungal N-terminal domain-containing protein n=1 Tax=Fusarium vanettenii (strain ATCC MYA-4622 / CBS 123669 / FGSC 9596 / NRRL 45880 / 77-13-4) TaxID=660122 RepID=C7YI38_FUSV7|nr:uncharacterized protein NECHADRAFT_75185 [Fusarium vanettenii 77-13-4]EEU48025.1 hypothetical protein NECHADRAFT_75185 [Fusarium vanettenii 77-13-4]